MVVMPPRVFRVAGTSDMTALVMRQPGCESGGWVNSMTEDLSSSSTTVLMDCAATAFSYSSVYRRA